MRQSCLQFESPQILDKNNQIGIPPAVKISVTVNDMSEFVTILEYNRSGSNENDEGNSVSQS